MSNYPSMLDVFLPLLDGMHPIAPGDMNELMAALEKIQETMGFGPEPNGTGIGPKGGAADVAARLSNLFSDTDATLRDFAFVTGSASMSDLTDSGTPWTLGLNIPFGIDMSGTDIMVLFATNMPGDASDGTQSQNATGAWWVTQIGTSSVWIQARLANGDQITPENDTSVNYGLLAFGPRAYY